MTCIAWWKAGAWCSAGVEVPHTLGLLGHSDADVALHALMDAMLGAMALGDIGKHFPDTDNAYAGAAQHGAVGKGHRAAWHASRQGNQL